MARRLVHKECADCGVTAASGAYISTRGLCPDCGLTRQVASSLDQNGGAGLYWDRWVAGMVSGLERRTGKRVLLVDPPAGGTPSPGTVAA